MTQLLDNIKESFFKIFIEWANGQYDLTKHSTFDYTLDLNYDIMDVQPINSVMTIGNQSVHRLFLPTNELIINYDINVSNDFTKGITTIADFDMYVSLRSGELHENVTNQNLKPNLVYIIPAGQYFNFTTPTFSNYFLTIRKKEQPVKNSNSNPTELKCVSFE